MSCWNSGYKNQPLKANNERKTKDHVRTAQISPIPIPDWHKEPVRLDNHLQPTRKVQDNEEFKQLMIYVRTDFIPDSLNSLPEEEEGEL